MEKKIKDAQVNAMCNRIDKVRNTIEEAMAMAYDLCKAGDLRMLQIRGAFSGIREQAEVADGFLEGLRAFL